MSDNVKGAKQPKGDKGGKGKAPAQPAAAAEIVDVPEVPTGPLPMPRMQERYRNEIVPALMKEFGYDNVMMVPRITKISVNIGLGEAIQNSKAIDAATGDLVLVTGQIGRAHV